jgi:hypothetical protein
VQLLNWRKVVDFHFAIDSSYSIRSEPNVSNCEDLISFWWHRLSISFLIVLPHWAILVVSPNIRSCEMPILNFHAKLLFVFYTGSFLVVTSTVDLADVVRWRLYNQCMTRGGRLHFWISHSLFSASPRPQNQKPEAVTLPPFRNHQLSTTIAQPIVSNRSVLHTQSFVLFFLK